MSWKNFTCKTGSFLCLVTVCLLCLSSGLVKAAENPGEEAGRALYKIGVGDVLNINVWKEPDLSLEESVVRLDGMITFPLLDDIKAAGLSSMELKAIISEKLAQYVEAPLVTVTLLDAGSRKFYILGEINQTGEYPIVKDLTVMQAFALAGGFTEWASKKEIILFRREKGKDKIIRVDYSDILDGDFSKNVNIKADDTIIVP